MLLQRFEIFPVIYLLIFIKLQKILIYIHIQYVHIIPIIYSFFIFL